MANGKLFGIGLGGALLTVLCCAAPSLVIGLGSLGLSAWAASTGYLLIPIVLAVIGLVSIWLYRSSRSTSSAADCRRVDSTTRKLK